MAVPFFTPSIAVSIDDSDHCLRFFTFFHLRRAGAECDCDCPRLFLLEMRLIPFTSAEAKMDTKKMTFWIVKLCTTNLWVSSRHEYRNKPPQAYSARFGFCHEIDAITFLYSCVVYPVYQLSIFGTPSVDNRYVSIVG